MRVMFVELPDLSGGPPTKIEAAARMAQADIRELVEPARPVEAARPLRRRSLRWGTKPLSRDERIACSGKVLGIEHPAFEAGELGANQRGAVLEILRAILRPDL